MSPEPPLHCIVPSRQSPTPLGIEHDAPRPGMLSMNPSQSSSRPLFPHVSGMGEPPPMQAAQAPPVHICVPLTHWPTPAWDGAPVKHDRIVPVVHEQPSSITPLQFSSRPVAEGSWHVSVIGTIEPMHMPSDPPEQV